MDKFFASLGKIILVALVIGLIAGGGYFLGKSGKINLPIAPQEGAASTVNPAPPTAMQTDAPLASPTATTAQAKKKTVTAGLGASSGLSFTKYSADVPEGWSDTHEFDNSVPFDTLTLTNGAYSIKIYQAATGGAQCVYPGDPPVDHPFVSSYDTFVEITTVDSITLRRSGTTAASGTTRGFTVCQKNTTENTYGAPTGFGHVSYTTPLTPDATILTQMDSIIGTLKKL